MTDRARSAEDRLDRYARRADGPLIVLALLFLLVLAAPILDPTLPAGVDALLSAANVAIWLGFGVDYVARLRLAEDRLRYVRTHLPVWRLRCSRPCVRCVFCAY